MATLMTTPQKVSKMLSTSMRSIIRQSISSEITRIFEEELQSLIEEKTKEVFSQIEEMYDVSSDSREVHIKIRIVNE